MPVVGDTFGLNSVYEKQVENVENRNFESWTESATYGYYGAGASDFVRSTITRLDFSNETLSAPGRDLPFERGRISSLESISYGYFVGGYSPAISTITRLDFSTDNTSLPGKNLPPLQRAELKTLFNNSVGYFVGGSDMVNFPLVFQTTITRFDFTSETLSSPGKTLSSTTGGYGFISSPSYGYFGGSYNPYTSVITRFDLLNETTSIPGKNFSSQRTNSGSVKSTSYGYFAGGFGPTNISTISRLDFSSETVSDPGKNLPSARNSTRGVNSSSYGYFGGGTAFPTYFSSIIRIDFSTESTNQLPSNFPASRSEMGGVSGGASVYRGAKTYGYFAGGRNSTNPAQNYSTIDRVDFSNETVSNPGKNFSSVRYSMDAMSNNFYGYFGGGYGSGAPAISTITRLDFSNETLSDPGKNLPTARTGPIATSSSFYGYFGGGYDPTSSFPKEINTITRLDFSNETVSDPGKNLLRKNRTMATSSNNFYGYFLGGLEIPGGFVTTLNTITRLDFSNETISNPGKNLPSERRESASLSSSSYGYFGGGYTPPATVLNTITRFDFSNETVSNPGKNLPAVRIRFAATSSNFYGYFGGGWDNFAFSNVTRLDFSNETVSASGQNLTISRGILSAVSNSN